MTTREIQHDQPFDADEFFGRIERMAGNPLPYDLDGAYVIGGSPYVTHCEPLPESSRIPQAELDEQAAKRAASLAAYDAKVAAINCRAQLKQPPPLPDWEHLVQAELDEHRFVLALYDTALATINQQMKVAIATTTHQNREVA